jgi:hypothetical protein
MDWTVGLMRSELARSLSSIAHEHSTSACMKSEISNDG